MIEAPSCSSASRLPARTIAVEVPLLKLLKRRRSVQRRFVAICTYGRSGSTLLMGLLNSLPHFCIRGENNNVLYRIYEACAALEKARTASLKNSEKTTHPWFGLMQADPDRFAQDLIQAFINNVLRPEAQHTTVGFKEIRFSETEVPDFKGYLAFVRSQFPGCKIIFNHRRLEDVASSKWWSKMPQAMTKLQAMEDRFNSVDDAEDVFHFHYDQIDSSLGHIHELFAFLDEDFDEQAVRRVLAVRHSY